MIVKAVLLIAVLFLAACAPDSNGGSGKSGGGQVISQEQRSRAELLGEFYAEWKAGLAKVQGKDQDATAVRLTEGFVLGSIANKYLLDLKTESLPAVLEVFRVLPDGNPQNAQLLKLAKTTLKN